MSNPFKGFLNGLTVAGKGVMAGRSTAYDHDGGGKDFWWLPPGESTVLTELEGPGCVTHIWICAGSKISLAPNVIHDIDKEDHLAPMLDILPVIGVNWDVSDPDLYRKVLIKITWDDMEYPSVLAPLGDFFGVCNGQPAPYNSMAFAVNINAMEAYGAGNTCGMNCYLPMPFQKKAKIELVSESENFVNIQFEVAYELYRDPLPEDTVYFHSCWRRENPTRGWAPVMPSNCVEINDGYNNLDGKDNFLFFEAEGKGHFVGCNLTVIGRNPGEGFPEGDDMFYIDGDTQRPTINGTGHECFFNRGYGLDAHPWLYSGGIIGHDKVPDLEAAYRYFIVDPIYFEKSIRFTMEHGHGNTYAEDWSATSYWYQTLPGNPLKILPLAERLPNLMSRSLKPLPTFELTKEQEERLQAYNLRSEEWFEMRKEFCERRYAHTRKASQLNIEEARAQNRRFREGK